LGGDGQYKKKVGCQKRDKRTPKVVLSRPRGGEGEAKNNSR